MHCALVARPTLETHRFTRINIVNRGGACQFFYVGLQAKGYQGVKVAYQIHIDNTWNFRLSKSF